MVAGFVHGVLNSDNVTITGESFDYGPYRFLPRYDVGFTAAYFDHAGLYAYGEQPRAVLRNLMRLGESLRPLAPDLSLSHALRDFQVVLARGVRRRVVERLGLVSRGEDDAELIGAIYTFLDESPVGYDRFFFDLHGGRAPRDGARYAGPRWEALRAELARYEPRANADDYFDDDGPCTLLIDEIESIWSAIAERDDWGPFEAKIVAIRRMGRASRTLAT